MTEISASPLTGRSRDNQPNPTLAAGNPYVPTNAPAIDDLLDTISVTANQNTTERTRQNLPSNGTRRWSGPSEAEHKDPARPLERYPAPVKGAYESGLIVPHDLTVLDKDLGGSI